MWVTIFFGTYGRSHRLSDRWLFCSHCRRPNDLQYFMEKKAGYLMYVPLVPLGSTTFVECPVCKSRKTIDTPPRDNSYPIFLVLTILFFVMMFIAPILLMAYIGPFLLGTLLFFILAGVVNGAYLLTIPPSHKDYPSMDVVRQFDRLGEMGAYVGPKDPSRSTASLGQNVQSGQLLGQGAGMPRAIYNPEGTCPHCMKESPMPPAGTVIDCPHCGKQFMS